MSYRQIPYLICILFCCVRGQQESLWTILQYEGLDDFYTQTCCSEETQEVDFTLIKNTCDFVKSEGLVDDYQSRIRVKVSDAKLVQIDTKQYPRYYLHEYKLNLYPCGPPSALQEFFLTPSQKEELTFFVFVYDRSAQEITLEALVQTMALASRIRRENGIQKVENSYVAQRESYYNYLYTVNPGKQFENDTDPVCTMDIGQKVRLCTSVLRTPYYRNKYLFVPLAANVQGECKETPLNLQGIDMDGSEDTYGCHVNHIEDPSQQQTIYLSRSYRNYEVFVFKMIEQIDSVVIVGVDNKISNLLFVVENEYVPEMDYALMELTDDSPNHLFPTGQKESEYNVSDDIRKMLVV